MNTKLLSTAFAATATVAAMGILSPQAFAGTLVPQFETEINVGLGCLDASFCTQANQLDWIESIESLVDDSTGTKSRLFVDNLETANTYTNGNAFVKFKAGDAGTNPEGFWFRPSEVDANGQGEEKGQLEVGTFKFDFTKTIAELTIDFLDVERNGSTGILAINGNTSFEQFLSRGPDDNIQSLVFNNVNSITLKLGLDEANRTGDGVDFQLHKSVPEPASALGLLVVGGLGAASRRKRNQG